MKKQLIIWILMIFGFSSKAQNMHFFNEIERDELLKGAFYRVHVENNSHYTLESDNGIIEDDKGGNFKFRPERVGNITLTIKNKKKTIVSQKVFKVREIKFFAYIMGSEKSINNLPRFCASSGIYMGSNDLICTDISHSGKYELIIIKSNELIYKTMSDKLIWSDETRENFRKLENGDLVLIYNVSFKIENNDYEAAPILLEVKI